MAGTVTPAGEVWHCTWYYYVQPCNYNVSLEAALFLMYDVYVELLFNPTVSNITFSLFSSHASSFLIYYLRGVDIEDQLRFCDYMLGVNTVLASAKSLPGPYINSRPKYCSVSTSVCFNAQRNQILFFK